MVFYPDKSNSWEFDLAIYPLIFQMLPAPLSQSKITIIFLKKSAPRTMKTVVMRASFKLPPFHLFSVLLQIRLSPIWCQRDNRLYKISKEGEEKNPQFLSANEIFTLLLLALCT